MNIKRRDFIKLSGATALGSALAMNNGCKTDGGASSNNHKKPNLLFVYADEHRRDCMGYARNGDAVNTPNFDAFAKKSAVFHNAIVEIPVCSPSRTTAFTGKYGMNHGTHRLGQGMLKDAEQNNLFEVLSINDYHIGYIGKWHINTFPHTQWQRELSKDDPEYFKRMHDGPLGIKYNMHKFVPPVGRPEMDYWVSHNNGSNLWQQINFMDDPDNPEFKHEWEVDNHTRLGINYLKNIRDKSKPFACFVSINIPHPGLEHDEQSNVLRTNSNVAPKKWEQPYEYLNNKIDRPNYTGNGPTYIPGYYGAVSSMDDSFGQLIQTLKDIGEYENTLIVYTSDHGDLVGSHGMHAKSVWYEESIGVPLMIGHPGIIEASEQEMIFSNVHLMPTLLGAMGLEVPGSVDGKDFSAALYGNDIDEIEEEFIGMMPSIYRKSDEDYSNISILKKIKGSPGWWGEWRGIRTKTHTYAVQLHKGKIKRHLYDNINDPYQLNPIVDEKLYKEYDKRVRKWLHPQDPFTKWVEMA